MLINTLKQRLFKSESRFDFNYQIIRSRRKTLCLQIKSSEVRVLAPNRLAKVEIIAFIQQKQAWIETKLREQAHRTEQLEGAKQDQKILCNGILKQLNVIESARLFISESDRELTLQLPTRVNSDQRERYINKQLQGWFEQQAKVYMPTRVSTLSQQLKLVPVDLKIKKYKARWGSCSSTGVISLNYLLMMTPDFVIDYVIVHELCHLKHMNHSRNFWDLVASFYPEYAQAKHWLKDNNLQLRAFHL